MTRNRFVHGSLLAALAVAASASADPAPVASAARAAPAGRRGRPEFARQPEVTRPESEVGGRKWSVSFEARGACDATVSVVDKDGRIVRHLASGMLGPNAPRPFKPDSLAQEVEWDGKDDSGATVPSGSSVRVGLGASPRLDRIIEIQEPAVFGRSVVGLAAAGDGSLFVLHGSAWERSVGAPEIAAFARDGKYLRTIVPFRADIPGDRLQEIRIAEGPQGLRVESPYPNFVPGLQGIYRTTMFVGKVGAGRSPRLITVSGRREPFVKDHGGRRLLAIGLDGSVDSDFAGPLLPAGTLWSQRFFLTPDPDGKTIWLAGLHSEKLKGNTHQVYKAAWSDREFVPVLGEAGVAGSDSSHFDQPRGLAFDSRGRLLVCDWMNDRIQVFSVADGPKLVASLGVPGPDQVRANPATGELYVLSVRDRGNMETYQSAKPIRWDSFADKSVVKFRSADDFTETARIALPRRPLYMHDAGPVLALDAGAAPPVLWISCVGRIDPGDHLWRIEDRGRELAGGPAPIPRCFYPFGTGAGVVATDPVTGDCYFAGRTCPTVLRIDAATGETTRLDRLAGQLYGGQSEMNLKTGYREWQIAAMAVDRQGRIYFRMIGQWSGSFNYIARFNRDESPAPFAVTDALAPPVDSPEKPKFNVPGALRVTQPSHGYHLAGLGVAPNGDLCVIDEGPGGKHRDPSEYNVLNVFAPDGALKQAKAIPHLTSGAWGPKFDRHGNMYITESVRPVGRPEGEEGVGSLVKFAGAAGELLFGDALRAAAGAKPALEMRRLEKQIVPVSVRNAAWVHFGVSPVPFGHCVCASAPFDLDGFDRAAVADGNNFRVKLLDSAGNEIAAMGRFANRDSRGPASDLPVPPIPLRSVGSVAVADDLVYIFDTANNRILRIAVSYETAATAPVP